jgi:hypothetical protein
MTWLERIIPFCNNFSAMPPKVFLALVVVFKPLAIPHEVIDGEDGVQWGHLIGPFSSIKAALR